MPRFAPSGEFLGYIGSGIDITERKLADKQVREQAALLDHARDAISERDMDDLVVYWNRSAETLFGWSSQDAVGKNVRDVLYTKDGSQFDDAKTALMRTGQWNGEFVLSTKNGNQINVDSSWTLVRDEDGQAKSVLVIHTDITERKRTEEQLLRAQRIESIGSLAGGIAHDLNNILSPIMMSLEVLRLKYTDEESQIWLRILHESAERGSGHEQASSFLRTG